MLNRIGPLDFQSQMFRREVITTQHHSHLFIEILILNLQKRNTNFDRPSSPTFTPMLELGVCLAKHTGLRQIGYLALFRHLDKVISEHRTEL